MEQGWSGEHEGRAPADFSKSFRSSAGEPDRRSVSFVLEVVRDRLGVVPETERVLCSLAAIDHRS